MSTINIRENRLRDKEYTLNTEFADVEASVGAASLGDIDGPTATVFTDIAAGVDSTSLTDTTGPTAISFSDIIYNVLSIEYVTNINTFEFASIPLNDILTFDDE